MNSVNNVSKNLLQFTSSLVTYQSVRWMRPRKPFWLGLAKTKKFVLRPVKVIKPEEEKMIYTLTNDYNTHKKSLLKFIREYNPTVFRSEENTEEFLEKRNLQKDIEASLQRNLEWNAQSSKLREERLKKMEEENLELISKNIEMIQTNEKILMEKVEKAVREEKIRSKNYITFDTLDEAVEQCVDSVVDYNYAIDLNGNKIMGTDPYKPSENKFSVGEKRTQIENVSQ